jgi:hypothetical protein
MSERQAAESMREAAAEKCDYLAKILRSGGAFNACRELASQIRALPLPEPTPDPLDAILGADVSDAAIVEAPDPERPQATGTIAATGATVRVYQESHDGWTPRQNGGQWEIVDRSGWVLATIHYDYRFTSNATNFSRAHMIARAPEALAEKEAALEALARIDAIIETGKVNHAKVAQKVARAALAKLSEGA